MFFSEIQKFHRIFLDLSELSEVFFLVSFVFVFVFLDMKTQVFCQLNENSLFIRPLFLLLFSWIFFSLSFLVFPSRVLSSLAFSCDFWEIIQACCLNLVFRLPSV